MTLLVTFQWSFLFWHKAFDELCHGVTVFPCRRCAWAILKLCGSHWTHVVSCGPSLSCRIHGPARALLEPFTSLCHGDRSICFIVCLFASLPLSCEPLTDELTFLGAVGRIATVLRTPLHKVKHGTANICQVSKGIRSSSYGKDRGGSAPAVQ